LTLQLKFGKTTEFSGQVVGSLILLADFVELPSTILKHSADG